MNALKATIIIRAHVHAEQSSSGNSCIRLCLCVCLPRDSENEMILFALLEFNCFLFVSGHFLENDVYKASKMCFPAIWNAPAT